MIFLLPDYNQQIFLKIRVEILPDSVADHFLLGAEVV